MTIPSPRPRAAEAATIPSPRHRAAEVATTLSLHPRAVGPATTLSHRHKAAVAHRSPTRVISAATSGRRAGVARRGRQPPPLTPEELEQIGRELERIAQQGREPGKYHRRTLPEQFGEEQWKNPERVIWW